MATALGLPEDLAILRLTLLFRTDGMVGAGSRRSAGRFGRGTIEGRAEAVKQLVDLVVVAYDERRGEREGTAVAADQRIAEGCHFQSPRSVRSFGRLCSFGFSAAMGEKASQFKRT